MLALAVISDQLRPVSFACVRWVDSCKTPFSRLSSSSVWEEADPLSAVIPVCVDVALICGDGGIFHSTLMHFFWHADVHMNAYA